jgi:site-specific DNA-methyltransferase (adenine-specific)
MTVELTAPATPAAREWSGWGTALKPAIEDWWVFRKPLSEGTVAANVLRWGTGALNIDASRVETSEPVWGSDKPIGFGEREKATQGRRYFTQGRFPANLITDGSDEVRAMFPQTTSKWGVSKNNGKRNEANVNYVGGMRENLGNDFSGDTGSASRFFAVCPLDEDDYPPLYYCAKASRGEREAGLDEMSKTGVTIRGVQTGQEFIAPDGTRHSRGVSTPSRNHHPTVKPLSLMRYLITLCTRPGATVLDPFVGSGSTLVACVQLGRNGIGCDNETEYLEIAKRRIEVAMPVAVELPMFAEVDA